MSETGYSAFSTTVDKTNHILREIEEAYGWPKERREQSYAALRAVLHTLRDRLTVEEANDLAAQLPMLVRGIYFEGWKPSRVPIKMDRDEFIQNIRNNFRYQVEGDIGQLVAVVMTALREYVTQGELDDVKSSLPKDVAVLLP